MTSINLTAVARETALERIGAESGATFFRWPTATAALDAERGVVLIATDSEPASDDWDAVCTLLELSGYHNGSDGLFSSDPGEPDWDAVSGVCTWSLSLPPTLEV
jgi:hypothetical protein